MEVGQTATAGQPVLTIARLDQRDVIVDVPEEYLRSVRVGDHFDIALQLDDTLRTSGILREIGPQADAGTRTHRLKIAIDKAPEVFRLGSVVSATPPKTQQGLPVVLPATAVVKSDGTDRVSGGRPGIPHRFTEIRTARHLPHRRPLRPGPLRAQGRRRSGRRRRQPAGRGTERENRTGAAPVNKFNLSDWALEHRSLVWYFMIIFAVAGAYAYMALGREEDPSFTIKTMVIQAQWPGASAQEVTQQVTDRIEKKLQELDNLEHTRSITTAGQTIVFVDLLPKTNAQDVKPTWSRVRNLIDDIRHEFPQGVAGPFFDDQFGDVYGNIFAFSGDGLSQRELRDFAEDARTQILKLPDVGKVDIVGAQDEVIYLEFSTRKIAALGLDRAAILSALQAQNAVTQSGFVEAGPERIALRVGGRFLSEDTLRGINLRVNDRFFALTDVASISRGYVDPPSSLFRFNGKPAIGLAIGMKTGGNLLAFGEALEKTITGIIQELPVGVSVEQVSDQPAVVHEAVGGFTKALFEAVAIVLAISFISLGFRAGLVVAIAIPLVLAITFMVMLYFDISLQRISLGALIIALGLLVDDAMIAVEMMVARLELGDSPTKAATYVYTSTAFPMLTGTLVTVAGFIPVAFNKSSAGEFTFTLFVVIAVSLVVSWIVAVVFTPLIGVTLLPKSMKKHAEHKGWSAKVFSHLLQFCLRWRWMTIIGTVLLFAGSVVGLSMVQQQFFPSSDRPELIIDWNLPQNSSIAETGRQMGQFEREVLAGNPAVEHWSTYVGRGAPRFVLSFDVQPADVAFGQTVIVTKGLDVRDKLKKDVEAYLQKTFPGTDAYVKLLEIGPPVGKPI